MKYLWIVAFLLISLFVVGASNAKEADNPESWEEWEETFLKTDGWKRGKNKKGIKTYTRKVDISPIDSFRGETEIEADMETVIGLFLDLDIYASLILLCSSLDIVKKVDETSYYLYSTNKVMWPVKTRDASVFAKWFYEPETGAVWYKLKTRPDYVPRNKKLIRVEIMTGYFKFTPKPDGKLGVVFESIVEVGGWIPAWIVNFYQAEIPYITLRRLQKKAKMEKYKGFKFDYKNKFEKHESPNLSNVLIGQIKEQ